MRSDVERLLGWLPDGMVQLLTLGGVVSWILVGLSVVVVSIGIFKCIETLLVGRGGKAVARALSAWKHGRLHQAIDELASPPGGFGETVRTAMQGRLSGASDALVREEVQRVASAHLTTLRSQLRTLEVIGQIAPLLGLFGTVLGMIEAFRQMEQAGSRVDPSVLSGGIWQALLTTGVGLAVAIPAILLHQWLERRCDAYGHRLEDAVTRVFTSDLYRPPVVPEEEAPVRPGLPARPSDQHAA